MTNSKLFGKILLTIIMLSSLSVNCAEVNTISAAGDAAAPVNQAGLYLMKLSEAEDAYNAIPENSSADIAQVAALKDKLQAFAQAFVTAEPIVQASGKQVAIDALTNMSDEFANKPVIKFIKNVLDVIPQSSTLQNNLQLIAFLNSPDVILDESNHTLLMHAAYNNHLEAAKILLILGSDPNFKDIDGHTALAHAKGQNNVDLINLLQPVTK